MEEKIEFKIPDHVIDFFISNYQKYPSIVNTRNISKEGLSKLTEKNNIEWSKSFFDGKKHYYNEGLIKYGNNKILMYFKKLEHENVFKLNILYSLEDNEHLNFLLVGLNKYYTID
jgi:hypothetical protein